MWLSKTLSKNNASAEAEKGFVTMTGDNSIEASATTSERNISVFTPYGISSLPPEGEEVLLMPSGTGLAALGVKAQSRGSDKLARRSQNPFEK